MNEFWNALGRFKTFIVENPIYGAITCFAVGYILGKILH